MGCSLFRAEVAFSWLRRILATLMPVVALACLMALFGESVLAGEPVMSVAVAQSGEAFVVDVTLDVPVSVTSAWDVLTDFDHMTAIFSNLKSSKVTARNGNIWLVQQTGVARYGLLGFSFESEREMRMEPMTRILARNLSGTLKRMESETRLASVDQGVRIAYHAEIAPDSHLARLFGSFFVRHEAEEQFRGLAAEMLRRQAASKPAAAVPG